jgi:hypothetical protein
MRITEFWTRMTAVLGPAYVDSFARDHVMSELDGRTVVQALADGESAKTVWRAVCVARDLPVELR